MNFQDYVQCANLLYTGICTKKKANTTATPIAKARNVFGLKIMFYGKLNLSKVCYVETKYRIRGEEKYYSHTKLKDSACSLFNNIHALSLSTNFLH